MQAADNTKAQMHPDGRLQDTRRPGTQ